MNEFAFLSHIPVLLILSLMLSVLYWIYVFFILYHLIRFGIGTRPKRLALIFFIGSIILFFVTVLVSTTVTLPTFDPAYFELRPLTQ